MKNNLFIFVSFALVFTFGCQNIGHNSSFFLKYKKNLRNLYEDNYERYKREYEKTVITEMEEKEKIAKNENVDEDKLEEMKIEQFELQRKQSQTLLEAEKYLKKIYTTNKPLSLSNHYDTRNSIPIREGDPLNIIINKVHMEKIGEFFPGDTAEVGVVVTVDDGGSDEPKNVLVAYEEGIDENVDLPISDLLAYSTNSYGSQPIRIEVTIFEFDQIENENYKGVLSSAAAIGSTLSPAFAPAISLANKIGNHLIAQNRDDIIIKFIFQIYPWAQGPLPKRVTASLGLPRISYGNYMIVNAEESEDLGNPNAEIHVDFNLKAHKIVNPDLKKIINSIKVVTGDKIKHWPIPVGEELDTIPLSKNYLLLSIKPAPVKSANIIISRLNSVNRASTGLANLGDLTRGNSGTLGADLENLKSGINLFLAEIEFRKNKINPLTLENLFKQVTDEQRKKQLNENDKNSIVGLISNSLPPITKDFKTTENIKDENLLDVDVLQKWYEKIKGKLEYDPKLDRYKCKIGKPSCEEKTKPRETENIASIS